MTPEQRIEQYYAVKGMAWKTELERLTGETTSEVNRILTSMKRDLIARLDAERDGRLAITDFSKERMTALDVWLNEILASYMLQTSGTIETATLTAGQSSVTAWHNILSVNKTAKAVQSVGFSTEQLQRWTGASTILGETKLQDWVDRTFDVGVKASVIDTIVKGGLEGKGVDWIARQVRGTALNGGVEITARHATTLSQTYVQAANVGAMRDTYAVNGSFFRAYRWVTAADRRVCLQCRGLSGREYPTLEAMPYMPRHLRCRCIAQGIIKTWRDLGIDMDNLPQTTQGMPKDYEEFWRGQSHKDKVHYMGEVRTKLLDDGRISWRDITDNQGNVRTLKELGYDRNGVKI